MAENTERQGIYIPTGAVLLIGGVTIAVTKSTNGAWVVVLVVALVVVGLYLMSAPFFEWPLPGRKALKEKEIQREAALELLMRFHATCVIARDRGNCSDQQFTRWFADLSNFVESAWGSHERTILLGGIWTGGMFYRLNDIAARIENLIRSADSKETRPSFNPQEVSNPEWLDYETRTGPDPERDSIFREPES